MSLAARRVRQSDIRQRYDRVLPAQAGNTHPSIQDRDTQGTATSHPISDATGPYDPLKGFKSECVSLQAHGAELVEMALHQLPRRNRPSRPCSIDNSRSRFECERRWFGFNGQHAQLRARALPDLDGSAGAPG